MFDIYEALTSKMSKLAKRKDDILAQKEKAKRELEQAEKAAVKALIEQDAVAYAEAEGNANKLRLVVEGCEKIEASCDERLTYEEASEMWKEYIRPHNAEMKKKLAEYKALKSKLLEKYIDCAKYQNSAFRVLCTLSDSMIKDGSHNIDNTAGFEPMEFLDNFDCRAFYNRPAEEPQKVDWNSLHACVVRRGYSPELEK